MEAIGAGVGTAVIFSILKKLASITVGDSLSRSKLVKELRSLELKLNLIKECLDDAESKQNRDVGVRAWLKEVKDAAYDAGDVLDEYVTDAALLQQRKGPLKFIKFEWAFRSTRSFKSEIKRIKSRFNALSEATYTLDLHRWRVPNIEDYTIGAHGRETDSLMDMDSPIIGRVDVKKKIIVLLKSNVIENITNELPVLPIVGMGGMGKTALVRSVFHDDEVKKHFSLRIWIFVSQEFDPIGMLRSIIECIYKWMGERNPCTLTTLEGLHNETKNLIENKKFLLILDDAWNEEQQRWNDLLSPLKFGDNGSKVLVTTRSETVAKSIDGYMNPIILNAMDDRYIWEILKWCAFKGIDNPTDKDELINIGKQIVDKLEGSPLAAKTIGRLLGTKLDQSHWMSILQSDLWEVEGQQEHDISPSLFLSYQCLPPKLKFCFSLCSLFPKGYQISKDELSYLWIAHDIFEVGHGMRPEDSALLAIADLRSRFLLFQARDDDFLTMHNLIHDVSEFVAQEDHVHIADEIKLEKHPNKLRHLSFSSMQQESKFPCENLRSVLCIKKPLYFDDLYNIDHRVLDSWLNESIRLRVLNLQGCKIGVLPKSIGKLKHLRCLNLSHTLISELPKSLTCLYNLQALWLESCRNLKKLPDGMENLVNLRLLKTDKSLVCKIKGIGRLSSLQELRYFDVDPKHGSGIEELENMDMLGGDLTIMSLENVADHVDAEKACLERKERLQCLTLEWSESNTVSNRIAEEVLEALQPNGGRLECLEIRNYKGRVLPSWLTLDGHLPASLHKLKFCSCHQIQSLTDMSLSASLQELKIENCETFTSLPSDMRGLTSLQSLELNECPEMESLADIVLPASLQQLKIYYCQSLASLPSDMTRLTSLKSLNLSECPKLQSFPESGLPPSLSTLTIYDCWRLQSFPTSGVPPSLSTLDIINCPELKKKYHTGPESALLSHILVHWDSDYFE